VVAGANAEVEATSAKRTAVEKEFIVKVFIESVFKRVSSRIHFSYLFFDRKDPNTYVCMVRTPTQGCTWLRNI